MFQKHGGALQPLAGQPAVEGFSADGAEQARHMIRMQAEKPGDIPAIDRLVQVLAGKLAGRSPLVTHAPARAPAFRPIEKVSRAQKKGSRQQAEGAIGGFPGFRCHQAQQQAVGGSEEIFTVKDMEKMVTRSAGVRRLLPHDEKPGEFRAKDHSERAVGRGGVGHKHTLRRGEDKLSGRHPERHQLTTSTDQVRSGPAEADAEAGFGERLKLRAGRAGPLLRRQMDRTRKPFSAPKRGEGSTKNRPILVLFHLCYLRLDFPAA